MNRSYSETFKLIKNVLYWNYTFEEGVNVTEKANALKRRSHIFLYCPVRKRIWQLRVFKIFPADRRVSFQVVYQWKLEVETRRGKKMDCDQLLLCDCWDVN